MIPFHYIDILKYGLASLFGLTALLQIIFYLKYFARVAGYKKAPQLKKYPITVIICARNEALNLQKNLKAVLEQKHENYEVIVVNDCSTDNTDDILGDYLKQYKHLRVTSIVPDKKFTHGKKLAITVGIKAAKNEWLVFTDADCTPVSDQWLNRIQENFSDKTDIVLGYGGYRRQRGFLNAYIRYDTFIIAAQYLGFALAKNPYMGVGRNLAYRKSLFFNNKGFASHYHLLSGDDDLFVNETATKVNTEIEIDPDSHTLSAAKSTWRDFFEQKRRHFTTSGRYKSSHYFKLGFEPLTRLLFYFCLCYLLVLNVLTIPILIIAGIRFMIQLIVIPLTMKRLSVRGLFIWLILFDLLSLFINFIIHLSTLFRRRKKQWK